ncbi:DUF1707 domain-containing protein [Nocardioides sp. C4-1]|uniref:DUF1707 SHOCT-like domain-containing protein n=1 Tax=Nocardioides sp. C4-1 TaxID=3151851 RepID=UPI003266C651
MATDLWASFPHDPRDRANAGLRASDADRERITGVLASAFADGRLEREELDERTDAVASARTLGDLPPLVADLVPLRSAPARPTKSLVGVSSAELEQRAQRSWEARRRAALFSFLGTGLICWAIWISTTLAGWTDVFFPWPLIVNAVTGVNLARVLTSRDEMVRDEVHRLEKKQARQQRWPKGLS